MAAVMHPSDIVHLQYLLDWALQPDPSPYSLDNEKPICDQM